jgi:hypothetical protein
MAKRDLGPLTEDDRAPLLALTKRRSKVRSLPVSSPMPMFCSRRIRGVWLRHSRWALRRWSGAASALSERASKRLCRSVHVLGDSANSMARRRRS